MLSIPKYPEQYAQHFPTIFYLLCCASQHHVWEGGRLVWLTAGRRRGWYGRWVLTCHGLRSNPQKTTTCNGPPWNRGMQCA